MQVGLVGQVRQVRGVGLVVAHATRAGTILEVARKHTSPKVTLVSPVPLVPQPCICTVPYRCFAP